MNKWIGIGRLTRDPDLRYTNSGTPVCNFTLAVDGYSDRTDFIKITTWSNTAENVSKYLEKGRMVAVEGELHIDKKEDKYYTSVNANQVKFLGGKSKGKLNDNYVDEEAEVDDGLNDDDFEIPF